MTAVRRLLKVATAWLFAALIAVGPAFAQDTLMGGAGGYSAAAVATNSGFDPTSCAGCLVAYSGSNNDTITMNGGVGSEGQQRVLGTRNIPSGTYIFYQFHIIANTTNNDFDARMMRVGAAFGGDPHLHTALGGDANSTGWWGDNGTTTTNGTVFCCFNSDSVEVGAAYGTGADIGVVINITAGVKKIWFTKDNGVTWFGGGTGSSSTNNPCTNTGGEDISTMIAQGLPIHAAASIFSPASGAPAADQVQLLTGTAITLTVPACATALT